MDTRTGDLYPSRQAALDAGVPHYSLLMVEGSPKAIREVRRRVHMVAKLDRRRRKALRKQQRRSRTRNR